jgi:hypothetical protein
METHIRLPLSAQAKLLHGHAFLDDLQSLDPGLYKNLIFVKHYDGDVEDLCLTFAGAKKPTLFDAIFSLKETIPFAKTGLGQSNAKGSSTKHMWLGSRRGDGKKTPFLRHFILEINILPRQARDKHQENSKKNGVFF